MSRIFEILDKDYNYRIIVLILLIVLLIQAVFFRLEIESFNTARCWNLLYQGKIESAINNSINLTIPK